MTSIEFETYVKEADRIKALRAIQLADVIMLPHITQFNRKEWFRQITKRLMPSFEGINNMISFNGRQVNFKQLKRVFKKEADVDVA